MRKIILQILMLFLLLSNLQAQKDSSKVIFGIRLSGGVNNFFSPKSYYHKRSPMTNTQLLRAGKIHITIADVNNELDVGSIFYCGDSINLNQWKTNYIFNKNFRISKTGISGICIGFKHYFGKKKSLRQYAFLNLEFIRLTTSEKGSFIVYPNIILTGFSDWRYENFQSILGSGLDYKFCKHGSFSFDFGFSLNSHKFYSTNDDFHLYMQERNYGFITVGLSICVGLTIDIKSICRKN